MKEVVTPYKNEIDGDSSNVLRHENGNDSDNNTLNSSSIKNLRGQGTPNHSMNKRQRKTTH